MGRKDAARDTQQDGADGARLDKWLWAARFYKTRTLSQEAIEGGRVRYEGERSKASKSVQLGAHIVVRQGWSEMEVVVRGLSEKRGGAAQAQQLYEETAASRERREREAEQRRLHAETLPTIRPDKKQRRLFEKIKRRLIDTGND